MQPSGVSPRVFISYSHDSEEHRGRVRELADRLCSEGVEAHLDQYEQPPPPNWPRWTMDEIDAAEFVLVVCTETYHRRFRGHEEPGQGEGATWEAAVITQQLYESHCQTTKFIPVIFDPADEGHIPIVLRGGSHYVVTTEDGYRQLCRVVTHPPATPRPERPAAAAPGPGGRNNLPFPPNPHFTGREKLLKALHRQLAEGPAAITQPQAIHGLGGVGKTQLAVEYAWEHHADYDALLWVVADSPENGAANLAALCEPEVLNLPEAVATEQEAQEAAVLRWLRQERGWLLILDSVDSPEAAGFVRDLIDPAWRGHVIITSRRSDWHQQATLGQLPVDTLPIARAARFLRERVRAGGFDPGANADARAVAEELGGLPLALEQAAAYMLRHRVTFADYVQLLAEQRPRLLAEEVEGSTRYQRSVAGTWLVSERQLSLAARAILRLTAFLAPDHVPRALLADECPALADAVRALAKETKQKPPTGKKRPTAEDALVELADHSLITLAPGTFSCHRLVQAVQSDRLDPETRRRWTELALRLVDDYAPFDADDVRTWPLWEGLRTHAETVVRRADALGIPEPTARLMNQLGLFLKTKALHREAEPLMRRALAIDEASFGADHPEVATDLNNLASLLQDTNRLGEAEPLMRRALAIDEASLGPGHPDIAIGLNNLAGLLQATNRLEEAEPLIGRVAEIFEKALGRDHPNVATALNNLAQLLQDTNRLGEAEPLMRRVAEIFEKALGRDHPNVATALNNLAQLLQDTNRLGEAEPLMRRVAEIFEKALGGDHPNVATALNNLAELLRATNRPAKAEPLYRRALAIDEASFGSDHPNVAIRLNNLALLLKATNRLGEAEPPMRRCVVIFRKFGESTGHEHPHMQDAIENYAALLRKMGLPEEEIRRRCE